MLLALALVVFIWSGIEDTDVITVTVLGVALSIAGVAWILGKRDLDQRWKRHGLVLLAMMAGACAGALSSLMTVALMLFKDIRHGHVFPDYSPALMLAMLERLPIWTIAGALMGCGCALLLGVFEEIGRRKRQTTA